MGSSPPVAPSSLHRRLGLSYFCLPTWPAHVLFPPRGLPSPSLSAANSSPSLRSPFSHFLLESSSRHPCPRLGPPTPTAVDLPVSWTRLRDCVLPAHGCICKAQPQAQHIGGAQRMIRATKELASEWISSLGGRCDWGEKDGVRSSNEEREDQWKVVELTGHGTDASMVEAGV